MELYYLKGYYNITVPPEADQPPAENIYNLHNS